MREGVRESLPHSLTILHNVLTLCDAVGATSAIMALTAFNCRSSSSNSKQW